MTATPAVQPPGPSSAPPFALYVEGPRDREILRAWAWRVSPALSRGLASRAVILGGRRPERAVQQFRALRQAEGAAARAVCVLDRDGEAPRPDSAALEQGLELFTWGRRHIESYLLVPAAILRCAGLSPDEPRWRRVVEGSLPPAHDEDALGSLDAKGLLGHTGALSRALGRPLLPGRLAREMDRAELHSDVLRLFGRLSQLLGIATEPASD